MHFFEFGDQKMNNRLKLSSTLVLLALGANVSAGGNISASVTIEELAAKLDQISKENAELRQRLNKIENVTNEQTSSIKEVQENQVAVVKASKFINLLKVVSFNNKYGYAMLDPNQRIHSKQRLLLENKKAGNLSANSLYLSGAVTGIANAQKSNTEDKFGWLMRHPTSNNQRTKTSSEAVIHSTQLAFTANLGDWTSAYMELLYSPEQSFGAGTNVAISRNLTQVRRGYVLFGNLNKSPFYASLGKMAIPFGLTDSVSPFTGSTVWHTFGGLANGLNTGYTKDGLNINVMFVQGGAQFRSANVPVDKSSTPSKLNNFAVDANYTFNVTADTDFLVGASYIKGSAYCQSFPVTHFSACNERNAAYDTYVRLDGKNWQLKAEVAQTVDKWPGSFNPTIPEHGATKVTSFDVGGKYNSKLLGIPTDYSLEFSRFDAGPSGAPWEKQDQWVLGLASFITPSTKLFAEYIHTAGYAPLNFVSGGNLGDGVSWSTQDAKSDVLTIGANVAF